jgi:hypothetical protein
VLKECGCSEVDAVTKILDDQIKNQNLQSSACIKAIGSFIRNTKKELNEDDLTNPITTYETDFEFLKEDIIKYRSQRIKHECFSVLHPWAYDLDKVDFKYIMNNDLAGRICTLLQTDNAQAFWLSFFKSQTAVAADDFFTALREVCQMNRVPHVFEAKMPEYQQMAVDCDFMISLTAHAEQVQVAIQVIADEAAAASGFNCLKDQAKLYANDFVHLNEVKEMVLLPSSLSPVPFPRFEALASDAELGSMQLTECLATEGIDLVRRQFDSVPDRPASHRLHLTFEAVDTEELKQMEISVDGT